MTVENPNSRLATARAGSAQKIHVQRPSLTCERLRWLGARCMAAQVASEKFGGR